MQVVCVTAVRLANLLDAAALQRFHCRLSACTLGLSVLGHDPVLSRPEALALLSAGRRGLDRAAVVAEMAPGDIVGLAHAECRADGWAPCSIVVQDDWRAAGLGSSLLSGLTEVGRARGWRGLRASVLPENAAMLRLAYRYGAAPLYEDESEIALVLPLDGSGAGDGEDNGLQLGVRMHAGHPLLAAEP